MEDLLALPDNDLTVGKVLGLDLGKAVSDLGVGNGNTALSEYRCQWGSNPEATANVLVAHARAVVRLAREGKSGAFTILDIPASYFSLMTKEELLAHCM